MSTATFDTSPVWSVVDLMNSSADELIYEECLRGPFVVFD